MLMPPQITFHGLRHSAEIETDILDRIAWLEKFYEGIVSCRVSIEVPHRHRRDGQHVHVTLELTVPNGHPIVVAHHPTLHASLKDSAAMRHVKESEIDGEHRYARIAVHDAFDAARRRLQDFARCERGNVKAHR